MYGYVFPYFIRLDAYPIEFSAGNDVRAKFPMMYDQSRMMCVKWLPIKKVYQTTRSDEDGIRKAVNSCVSKDLTVLMTFDGFRALLADYLDLAYHIIYASSQAIYEDFCSGCRNPKVSHGARKRCVESASSRAWAKWIEDQTQSQESVPTL